MLRPSAFLGALGISRKMRRNPHVRRIVQARLIAAGLGSECTSCRGSGVFRASREGAICYACNGLKQTAPPLDMETLKLCRRKQAREQLARADAIRGGQREALRALPAVLAEWDASGIFALFNPARAARHSLGMEAAPRDAALSVLNDSIAEAVRDVERLHSDLERGLRDYRDCEALAGDLRSAAARASSVIAAVLQRLESASSGVSGEAGCGIE